MHTYLNKKNFFFYDSLTKNINKKTFYINPQPFVLGGVMFKFSDGLKMKFYFKSFHFVKNISEKRKWNLKDILRETPSEIKICFYDTEICKLW